MEQSFDTNLELAQGYRDWCTTEKGAWEGNKVGELLADQVKFIEKGSETTLDRAAALDRLAALKETTIVDPLSVRVATRGDDTSFGSDWEEMDVVDRQAGSGGGWHHCIDKFEWTGNKISAIHVCFAEDHSQTSHA